MATSVIPADRVGQSAIEIVPRALPLVRMMERRFDVVTAEQLSLLASQPVASSSSRAKRATAPSAVSRVLYRDLFIDTADDHLQRRGITCRFRVGSHHRPLLTAFVGEPDESTPPPPPAAAGSVPRP